MMTKVDDGLIIVGLFVSIIIVNNLLRVFLLGEKWLPDLHFGEQYPKLAWLPGFYTFFQIILISFSVIFVGRSLQSATSGTFFVFIIFVPIISVSVLQAVIEITFIVSSYSVPRRWGSKGAKQFYFAYGGKRVRLTGFIRLGINIGLLATMIYFLL